MYYYYDLVQKTINACTGEPDIERLQDSVRLTEAEYQVISLMNHFGIEAIQAAVDTMSHLLTRTEQKA